MSSEWGEKTAMVMVMMMMMMIVWPAGERCTAVQSERQWLSTTAAVGSGGCGEAACPPWTPQRGHHNRQQSCFGCGSLLSGLHFLHSLLTYADGYLAAPEMRKLIPAADHVVTPRHLLCCSMSLRARIGLKPETDGFQHLVVHHHHHHRKQPGADEGM